MTRHGRAACVFVALLTVTIGGHAVSANEMTWSPGPAAWKGDLTPITAAQGDKLVWRNTVRAKHTGDFMGSAPTGRPVAFGGIGIWRVSDGQVKEMWVEGDFLGLLQQVGAAPEAAAAS